MTGQQRTSNGYGHSVALALSNMNAKGNLCLVTNLESGPAKITTGALNSENFENCVKVIGRY